MWGVEGNTYEEKSQGNKLALKQLRVLERLWKYTPLPALREKMQIYEAATCICGSA
jgi:hypothetical protein